LSKTFKVLILSAIALACTAPSVRAQVTPVEARIASVSGAALVSNGGQAPRAAQRRDVLSPGEEIDTRGGGHLTIELSDGSIVLVRPGSRVLLKDFRAADTLRELFEVLLGRVRVKSTISEGSQIPTESTVPQHRLRFAAPNSALP